MNRGVVVRGRLHGRHIELDEKIDEIDGEVEVMVRPVLAEAAIPGVSRLLAILASFPPGTRAKEDIDGQIADERAAWDRRE